MKLLLKIAYFNLWRRKSRSILVISMIAVSIVGLLLIQGLYQGMIQQMVDNGLRSDSGHISIYHKEFRTSKSLNDQVTNPEAIMSFVQAQSEFKTAIARIRHEGLVATAKHSQGATFIGTKLDEESVHSNMKNYLIEGAYTFGKRGKGALIGVELAKKLKVSVGKKIILTVQDKNKEINAISLKVKGIVRINNIELDRSGIFIDRDRLSQFIGLEGQVTQVSIFAKDRQMQETLLTKLKKQYEKTDLKVYLWTELFPMFDMVESMQATFFIISYGLVFIIAAIGIFGVILVSVLERVREFGIMLAIGSSFRRVRWQIISESVLLGLFGLIIGVIIGGFLLYYFTEVGIDLRAYSDAMSSFGMDAVIKAQFEYSYFYSSGIAVVLATFLAALWPIRVLRKLNPIEAVNAN